MVCSPSGSVVQCLVVGMMMKRFPGAAPVAVLASCALERAAGLRMRRLRIGVVSFHVIVRVVLGRRSE